jgi:hypothetical protein
MFDDCSVECGTHLDSILDKDGNGPLNDIVLQATGEMSEVLLRCIVEI